jgi:hypothetical protein
VRRAPIWCYQEVGDGTLPDKPVADIHVDIRVNWVHRTARDFVQQQATWNRVLDITGREKFDAQEYWAKGCFRMLNATKTTPRITWAALKVCIDHAVAQEHWQLLDEIGRTAMRRGDLKQDLEMLLNIRVPDLKTPLDLAAYFGLASYFKRGASIKTFEQVVHATKFTKLPPLDFLSQSLYADSAHVEFLLMLSNTFATKASRQGYQNALPLSYNQCASYETNQALGYVLSTKFRPELERYERRKKQIGNGDPSKDAVEQAIRSLPISGRDTLTFDLPRERVRFIEALDSDCDLDLVPTVTGTPTETYAATAREYLHLTWPEADLAVLDLLDQVRRGQSQARKATNLRSSMREACYRYSGITNLYQD